MARSKAIKKVLYFLVEIENPNEVHLKTRPAGIIRQENPPNMVGRGTRAIYVVNRLGTLDSHRWGNTGASKEKVFSITNNWFAFASERLCGAMEYALNKASESGVLIWASCV